MSGPEIITFGCRLNSFESEIMRDHAQAAGVGDLVVVHTCAVTAEAERQARQAIRRARRSHPRARIVVTGCSAQIRPEAYAAMAEVDHVVGNPDKLDAATVARARARPAGGGARRHDRARDGGPSGRRLRWPHARVRPGAERV